LQPITFSYKVKCVKTEQEKMKDLAMQWKRAATALRAQPTGEVHAMIDHGKAKNAGKPAGCRRRLGL
jgi:hypothetical protein